MLRASICRAATAVGAVLSLAGPAGAHPHVFIDGGIDFVFDADGLLTALRVTWIYDPLTSLFMSEDLGLEDGAELTPEDRRRLAAYQTEWAADFAGDSYLWDAGRPVRLSGPVEPDADIVAGQIHVRFVRRVEPGFRPGADTLAKAFDPTYFTAYAVTVPPRLEGNAVGCAVEVVPFEPTRDMVSLQRSLVEIPIDGTPEQEVGSLFADRIELRCG